MKLTSRSIAFLGLTFAAACFGVPLRAAAANASSCAASPANRALDFWLGQWTIAAPGGAANATSTVTLQLDKCLIVERWNGGRGHTGENVLAYSSDDQSWHGFFADNEGRVHVFLHGKASPGSVEFSAPGHGPKGESILNRVTISRINADQVEQLWQKSSDDGKTWTTAFRGQYTRKQPQHGD